ncbi:MAG: hypothetical protein OEV40_03265 [Acidimicrobiia bacterium]|nr:hypothetical protein [Acidimicrobiia bacterium]
MSDLSTRVLISISLVITGVGALDALLGREWDLLTVFGLSAIVQTTIWLRQRANRIPVTLRPDLAHWIETQAQQTGEPFDDILDRTVAWHRHGLYEHQ